jgi:transposase
MEVIYDACAGLDVHKKTVMACLRTKSESGRRSELRSFSTTTRSLLELSDWLRSAGCTHVAMESTGVYWRPVYQILEEEFELLLVNAQHVKMVPGRKTDVKDSEWLAQLLEHGLLRSSFVPPSPIRQLRELTRYRRQVVQERAREANRVQKILETANIKLGDVATDVLGVSGLAMLRALVLGERDPERLADLARGALKKKRGALTEALFGRFTEHHAFLIGSMLEHIGFLEQQIAAFDERISQRVKPFESEIALLDEIPGVARRSAEQIIAELGPDMTRFPTPGHAASWAGLCPGNNESAGKRRSGRTRKGNRWLRSALVESARGAVRKRDCYFSSQYRHVARRRGDNRAIVAVAHSILTAVWHMLRSGSAYKDLGVDHFDQLHRARLVRYHQLRLAELGVDVTVADKGPVGATA